jgi:hypothetical protein
MNELAESIINLESMKCRKITFQANKTGLTVDKMNKLIKKEEESINLGVENVLKGYPDCDVCEKHSEKRNICSECFRKRKEAAKRVQDWRQKKEC